MSRLTTHDSRLTTSEVWTVVPVRGIADGKSRLAGVLSPLARAGLNRQLLERTLTVLDSWSGNLARCVVVSPCRQSLETAASLGAVAVLETGEESGLNGAAAAGASYASQHGAGGVLILPCDLPYLTPESLTAVVHAVATAGHMVIAPDKAGTGTNALLVSAQQPFEFRFGERSFERHMSLAAERGWTAAVCSRPELAFDLDTPQDLALWPGAAERTDPVT